jgi:lipopolysaccharide assembly protein A
MKILFRIVAIILFVLFFGFALKNTQEVALGFFWDYELRGPLVLLLLGFFAGGFVFGILGMAPILFRHKRDLSRQRKAYLAMQKENEAHQLAQVQPPPPDSVITH